VKLSGREPTDRNWRTFQPVWAASFLIQLSARRPGTIAIQSVTRSLFKSTLLAVMVCTWLAACAGASPQASSPAAVAVPPADERVPVYVVRREWHVDIGLALADVQPPLLPVAAAFHDSHYLFFGFGDRRYLLHGGTANFVAALWGGPGLVLVTSVGQQPPERVFGPDNVVRVALTPQQMSALQSYIGHTFATHDGAFVPLAPDPHAGGSYSAYYASTQRYSGLHTCNTWAAEALKSAQLPVSSSGVEFATQLWQQVQHLQSAGAESRAAHTP
jgi:Protein of unknown function (DUF2459)